MAPLWPTLTHLQESTHCGEAAHRTSGKMDHLCSEVQMSAMGPTSLPLPSSANRAATEQDTQQPHASV